MRGKKYIEKLLVCITALVLLAGVVLATLDEASADTINGSEIKCNKLQMVYYLSTSGSTTTISWELWCTRTNTSYKTYKKSAATVVQIDGKTLANTNTYYDVRDGSKKLLNGTTSVSRSNGAAKSVYVYASVNLSGTTVGGTLTLSGYINLPAYTVSTKSVTAYVDWIDNSNAEGKRPASVTVTLYQNGKAYKTSAVSTGTNKVTFSGLPTAYGGTAYAYTVGGSNVTDYLVSEQAASQIVYKYARPPEMGFRLGFAI